MIISKDLCKKCGLCAPECEYSAIGINDDGDYAIDQSLCTNCKGCLDIECIRVCKYKAITTNDGSVPEIDTTTRILSDHISWFIAIMGARGNDAKLFPPGQGREWTAFRKLIGKANANPEMNIRITYGYDDICRGCPGKKTGCRERQQPYHIILDRLGVEAGAVINVWDLVKLYEDKFSVPFMKDFGYGDDIIECVRTFLSPDAKFHTNN